MHANNDIKIHPVGTKKPLSILISPKDEIIPTTGNKIRDYYFYTEPVLPCPRNAEQTKSTPSEGRFRWPFLDRTPPPPVRRHHQIAASGRDP